MIFGIDVSKHQGRLDWGRVANEPCTGHKHFSPAGEIARFAIVKATEASGYTDPEFLRNATGARAAGLASTAYHFLWGHVAALVQAEYFAKIAADAVRGNPVLDWEGIWDAVKKTFTDLDAVGAVAVLRCAREFGEHTERLWGRELVVYTGPGWVDRFPKNDDLAWLAKRALWVAHYTDGSPIVPKPWAAYWAHQFDGGQKVRLPTGGPVDANFASDLATAFDVHERDTDPGLAWSPTEPPPALQLVPEEQATVQGVLDMVSDPIPASPTPTRRETPTSKSSDRLRAVREEDPR